MRTIVKGKNTEIPDRVRTYVERKARRLERFLDDRTDALVELSIEQHRSAADTHIVEVTLVMDGRPLRGRAAGPTYEAAIDSVVDRIERRAIDAREKPREARMRGAGERSPTTSRVEPEDETRVPRVVKTKRFAIEPMFEEDAIARMESLGHAFFVFVNAENERFNVLYRRTDGQYGLIEPVLGGEYTPRGSRGTAG